jgi:hypothetical protein
MNLMQHKLAIVTTHPIQYYAPLFRLLHQQGSIDYKSILYLRKSRTSI